MALYTIYSVEKIFKGEYLRRRNAPQDTEAPLTLDEPGSILKGNNCGGRMIAFQPMEMKNIRVVRKSGIELLGFKKINEDLSHYIKAVKFIGVDPLATTGIR